MANAAEIRTDYLEFLNPAQRQAASFGQTTAGAPFSAGPLLVIAGAGTGKTMTLAHRVAHLIIPQNHDEPVDALDWFEGLLNKDPDALRISAGDHG